MAESSKPLPLKQRTSSIDQRRDFSVDTWWSLRSIIKLREYFVTVDNFSIWRRHLSWARTDGADLKGYLTQRFSSSMVFMSLILATELNVLFNSARITTDIRQALKNEDHSSQHFWIGITIIVSVVFTLFSLLSTFTAWGMVSAVADANAHCVLRSSIGQYVAELPGRFIVMSIYTFLLWFIQFILLLLPFGVWSALLILAICGIFMHIMVVFSAFGRIIMHSGSMKNERIFEESYEMRLYPRDLQSNLFKKAKAELKNKTSITRQYRRKLSPIDRRFTEDDLCQRLESDSGETISNRPRADSQVRFAEPVRSSIPPPPRQEPHTLTPLSEESSRKSISPEPELSNSRSSNLSTVEIDVLSPSIQKRPLMGRHDTPPVLLSEVKLESTRSIEAEWLQGSLSQLHPPIAPYTGEGSFGSAEKPNDVETALRLRIGASSPTPRANPPSRFYANRFSSGTSINSLDADPGNGFRERDGYDFPEEYFDPQTSPSALEEEECLLPADTNQFKQYSSTGNLASRNGDNDPER